MSRDMFEEMFKKFKMYQKVSEDMLLCCHCGVGFPAEKELRYHFQCCGAPETPGEHLIQVHKKSGYYYELWKWDEKLKDYVRTKVEK